MIFSALVPDDTDRNDLRVATAKDEADLIDALQVGLPLARQARARIAKTAGDLIETARRKRPGFGGLEGFLAEYRLSSPEGVVLMCLAEALLRIPDTATADSLIRDKIGSAHWEEHLGHSPSAFVNASTWALMLTGRWLQVDATSPTDAARSLAERLGETVVREALTAAMGILGRQFVMGRTIGEALANAQSWESKGYAHSFDMLGEAARTKDVAQTYFTAYAEAIAAVGKASKGRGPQTGPGISVKLSALSPRFEIAQRDRIGTELTPRLLELCRLARDVNIGLTIDAEESERLEPTLDVMARVLADSALDAWDGLGVAVQAYQKRAMAEIEWLMLRSQHRRGRLMVRLVKGAYWDGEIKRAQERGLAGFPVFTRKAATDLSYLACADRLLAAGPRIFPQFASHNAHTIAAVITMAGERRDWEFQRLHGMGEAIYAQVVPDHACRTYAPVGAHQDLLPYLVRRLLENGANTSFVNRMADDEIPADLLAVDPRDRLAHPAPKTVKLPAELFRPERANSQGLDLSNPTALIKLDHCLESAASRSWSAPPIIAGGERRLGHVSLQVSPADHGLILGETVSATATDLDDAMTCAKTAQPDWDRLGGEARARLLEAAADALEAARTEFMLLAIREAGKTLPDAVGEVREAVDFLRFYAIQARRLFGGPMSLPGPVGESNHLGLHGRGVFVCISPWNFPLAIFIGQVAAALAAGNAVIAKPAPQTPLMAAAAIRLLLEAGIPPDILHLVPGGREIGQSLVGHRYTGGIAFTGSTVTARAIFRQLAAGNGPLIPVIAETGGVNAMIVDSSALAEQVVADVIESAFRSAGQRCSALRVLYVQREAWARISPLLAGAVQELTVGDPARLATDMGPVIDAKASAMLQAHADSLVDGGRLLVRGDLPADCAKGSFFAPMIWEMKAAAPTHEVFGPILHVVPWETGHLGKVCAAITATGSGLTLGIHSRIDATITSISQALPMGNIYVNRSMIGAVVGSQPFGGQGLSGTGPKAGSPYTLLRYGVESCLTVNTAASGGDPALLGSGGDD
ncbi:Bifunctional proline dehydrogenase/pyrroline-5-carboxylate dehydrogenase [Candidatus Terasakiella magnetica]|nr:Bifunctional proline dehydrogenase/pyrroline-5-carboxylate dehydrogenase [Candidatus Terasakiella magnetica]